MSLVDRWQRLPGIARTAVLGFACCTVVSYLVVAFVTWSWDPSAWNIGARMTMAIMVFSGTFASIGIGENRP